jgi:hypothetical protein
MSVSRSSTSSLTTRLSACLPTFFHTSSQSSSAHAHNGASIAPSMGHGRHYSNLRGAGWNGAAMLFGTLAWMAVYYAKDLFAEMDDDGATSFIMHSLAMGIVANLAVYPFVKLNHLSRGESGTQANAEFRKYFILCTIPDALYEPTADWLTAMATADSLTEFDFVKYAQPTFNPKEAAGAFAFFGVVFGMIYYFGDKFIQYLAPDEAQEDEEVLASDAEFMHKSLRVCRRLFESDEGVAVMAALQYFIFYLTDDLFEVDWESFQVTVPQVLGMAGLMGAYTFAVDAVPVLLDTLENKYYPQEKTADNSLAVFIQDLYKDDLRERLLNSDETKDEPSSIPARVTLWGADPARPASSQSLMGPEGNNYRV